SAAKRRAAALGVWALAPLAALGLGGGFAWTRTSDVTRQRIKSTFTSVGEFLLQFVSAYQEAVSRFERGVPTIQTWAELAAANPAEAVLLRALLYTLARSPESNRSAAELTREIPELGVAQGETKVRKALRDDDNFLEVWRGRWQVGELHPV